MRTCILASLLFSVFLLSNCERDTDFDLPQTEPKISLNAHLVPVDTVLFPDGRVYIEPTYIFVGRSSSVFDKEGPVLIKASSVKLYKNHILRDTFSFDEGGNYSIKHAFQPGNHYRIVAQSENLGEASGEVYMPEEIPLTSAEWDTTTNKVRFSFKDPPGPDFYSFEIVIKQKGETTFSLMSVFEKTDPDIYFFKNQGFDSILAYQPNDLENTGHEGFLTDDTFDGGHRTVEVMLMPAPAHYREEVRVIFNHISPDLYEYRKTLSAYMATKDNPFAEGVKIHGNVHNGFGVVGASTPTRIEAVKK